MSTDKTTKTERLCDCELGRNGFDRWAEVAAVESEIRLVAYASAGDPKRMDDMRMYAIWAGRLQKALGHD